MYAGFEEAYTGDEIRKVYTREVSQIEFELQRSMNHLSEVKSQLLSAEGYTISSLVTQTEVQQYRNLKMEWLNNPGNEPNIQTVYFELDKVKAFIDETAKEIREYLG